MVVFADGVNDVKTYAKAAFIAVGSFVAYKDFFDFALFDADAIIAYT